MGTHGLLESVSFLFVDDVDTQILMSHSSLLDLQKGKCKLKILAAKMTY